MEFAYDGGGLAKGGDVTLYYDGKPVGKGRVEQTHPDGLLRRRGLRRRAPTPARRRLPTTARPAISFTGEIAWVQIDIGDDSHDHLITPEERFNLAMAAAVGESVAGPPGLDEDALGFDRDAVLVGEMADDVGLHALAAVDSGFRV